MEDFSIANVRNEIKAQIIRAGMKRSVDLLDEYGWSDSVFNLLAVAAESIRYKEVLSLPPCFYDIVWQKTGEVMPPATALSIFVPKAPQCRQ